LRFAQYFNTARLPLKIPPPPLFQRGVKLAPMPVKGEGEREFLLIPNISSPLAGEGRVRRIFHFFTASRCKEMGGVTANSLC
jgi:hypothetical protein